MIFHDEDVSKEMKEQISYEEKELEKFKEEQGI